jgi:uncharacterized protein YbjT (DUF2867 family)
MRLVIAGASGTVGRYVVEAARSRGHETVALSRASGQDVVHGLGLTAAMAGAHAVIDVTSTRTTSAARATAFFTAATRNLQRAEIQSGVGHHIALSIVGIDSLDAGYYAGKLAHERAVSDGPVAWSLLRATQFHEFAEQIVQRASLGNFVAVPKMLMRPVAAREVGTRLVELAEGRPVGRAADLAGPGDEALIDMVRRMFAVDGVKRHCVSLALPGKVWRGSASGALRGNTDTDRGNTGFDEWLAGPDHHKGQ